MHSQLTHNLTERARMANERAADAVRKLPNQMAVLMQHDARSRQFSSSAWHATRDLKTSCYHITHAGQDPAPYIMMGMIQGGIQFLLRREVISSQKEFFMTRVSLAADALAYWGYTIHNANVDATAEKLLHMAEGVWTDMISQVNDMVNLAIQENVNPPAQEMEDGSAIGVRSRHPVRASAASAASAAGAAGTAGRVRSSRAQTLDPHCGKCVICYTRPITHGFMHGRSVHACACLVCATTIMDLDVPRCPLCREECEQVQVFTS